MGNIAVIVAAALLLFGIQFASRYLRARRLKYWFEKGMEHYKAKRFDEALPAFRKCVRIAPEWLHARTFMGISLAQTGNREGAMREIEMVEALQPREAETWTLIITFFLLCMPEEDARLLEALERLAALDIRAVTAILQQPALKRYTTPGFQALKQRLDASR